MDRKRSTRPVVRAILCFLTTQPHHTVFLSAWRTAQGAVVALTSSDTAVVHIEKVGRSVTLLRHPMDVRQDRLAL